MANLQITYEELRTTAMTMDHERDTMLGILTRLHNQVSTLVDLGFRTDKASGQFAVSYQDLDAGMAQAIGGLEGMAQFLRAVADAYSTTDRDLASAIRG